MALVMQARSAFLTDIEIGETISTAIIYFGKRGFTPSIDAIVKLRQHLIGKYEHCDRTDRTMRMLTEELMLAFERLRDEHDERKLGAVPVMEEKLWPIEDEL